MLRLLFIPFVLMVVNCHCQQWLWAYSIDGQPGTGIVSITNDYKGNLLVLGQSAPQTFLNSKTGPVPADSLTTFVAKYNNEGKVKWISGMSGGLVSASHLDVDQTSNCYFTGQYSHDYFLAKYDSNGAPLLFTYGGNECSEWGEAVRALSDNNYLHYYYDEVDCNDPTEHHQVKKFDSQDSLIWNIPLRSDGLAAANDGGFVASAYWLSHELWLSGTSDSLYLAVPTPASYSDVFVTKYNSAGNPQWARRIGGKNYQWSRGVIVDGKDNVVVAAESVDTCFFDSQSLFMPAERSTYLIKTDDQGNLTQYRSFAGAIHHMKFWLTDLQADKQGNIYMAAIVDTHLVFNEVRIPFPLQKGEAATVIIKLDSALNYMWSTYIKYTGYNYGFVHLAPTDSMVYVVMNYDTDISLSGSSLQFSQPSQNGRCIVAALKNLDYVTGIRNDDWSLGVHVYPNPTHDKVIVSFNSKGHAGGHLNVYDAMGRCLLVKDLDSNAVIDTEVNLGEFRAGIYFLRVYSENEIVIKKVVKN